MKILTEKELADCWNVSCWTIRNWRLNDGLPHLRTKQGRIYYNMDSVENWWLACETTNTAAKPEVYSGIRRIE